MNHTEYTEKRNGLLAAMVSANEAGDNETFQAKRTELEALDADFEKITDAEEAARVKREREDAIEQARKKGLAPSRPAVRPDQESRREANPRSAPQYRENFLRYLRTGREEHLRDLSHISGPDGAYAMAPAAWDNEIISAANAANGLLGEVDFQTVSGTFGLNGLSISARSGNFVKGTQVTIDTDTEADVTFKERKLSAWPFTSYLKVPNEWLDANLFADPLAMIFNELNLAIEDNKEALVLYGTGQSEPLGLMTASAQGVSSSKQIETYGTGGKLTFAQLVAMTYAVKPKYRKGASWGFCKDAMIQIEALRDSGEAPILKQNLNSDGYVTTLLGHPIKEYPSITPTANATTGLFSDDALVGFFGNLKFYKLIQPSIVGVVVDKSRLVEKYQTLLIVRTFLDGGPKTEEAFAIAKIVN